MRSRFLTQLSSNWRVRDLVLWLSDLRPLVRTLVHARCNAGLYRILAYRPTASSFVLFGGLIGKPAPDGSTRFDPQGSEDAQGILRVRPAPHKHLPCGPRSQHSRRSSEARPPEAGGSGPIWRTNRPFAPNRHSQNGQRSRSIRPQGADGLGQGRRADQPHTPLIGCVFERVGHPTLLPLLNRIVFRPFIKTRQHPSAPTE